VAESDFSESGAAVICAGPRGVLLTDDGWLATKATAGFEALGVFRLIKISSIKNIELVENDNGKMSHFLFRASLIVGMMTFAALLIRDGEVLWDGCVDAVDGIIFSGCEGEHSTLQSVVLAILTMGIPLTIAILIFCFDLWPRHISIEQENGKKSEIKEDFEWIYLKFYAGFFVIWWVASPIGTAGLQSRFASPVNLLFFVFVIGAFAIYLSANDVFRDKSKRLGVRDFFANIEEEGRDTRKELEREFRSESKRLVKYGPELSRIFSDYETIFKPGSTRQAVLTIATCVENLFKERLRTKSEEIKKWVDRKNHPNTYANLHEKLMREDKNGIGKAKNKSNYIGDLRNKSTHDKPEPSLDETKVAVRYFVDLVEIHFEQPIVGESSVNLNEDE